MNKEYKLNKELLDLLIEHKNNDNVTFKLSNNDMRILLTYIEILQKENKKYKEVIDKAIKLIEDSYYSKNTTDIDSIVLSSDKLIKVRKILKEVE